MHSIKCYFTNCEENPVANWINKSNTYLSVCEDHLKMLQMVYDYEIMDEGLYKALPSDDQIIDEEN
jgi:hypothetical protein